MNQISIPKGSVVLLGMPTDPMPRDLSNAIEKMLRNICCIREAYLPQCYVKAVMKIPAQVLVLVLDRGADFKNILNTVDRGLTRLLPEGIHLDVWPMNDYDNLLSAVQETLTLIYRRPPRKKSLVPQFI